MNKLIVLTKRELWENRGAIWITPIVISTVYIVFTLMGIVTQKHFDNNSYTLTEGIRFISEQSDSLLDMIYYEAQLGPFSSMFTMALAIVVIFYLLGALYDDRKNKSILFWKSLPASDALTIASKLVTAMLVAPLVFWGFLVITQIALMLIFSVVVWGVGMSAWDVFLSHAQPFKAWGMILLTWLAQAIWALPLYGWLLLVSSFAPRIPLLFAILPPVVFGFLQWWITFLRTFTLGSKDLFGAIGRWFSNSPVILSANISPDETPERMVNNALGLPLGNDFDHAVTVANIFDRLFSTQMLVGLILAALMIVGAWWLRRRAAEG